MHPSSSDPVRILIVDDDPTTLLPLRALLEADGYKVEPFDDPTKALERARRGGVDIIISDYEMPRLDGLQFLRRVRILLPDSVRILLTGRGEYDIAIAAINQGEVYRYMTKPYDEQELRLNVRLAAQQFLLQRRLQELMGEVRKRDAIIADLRGGGRSS